MQKTSVIRAVIALSPLTMALPFAMDMYVPAIPRMTASLHTSDSTMQLTLNLFIFMSGITQLFIGPLTDWLGRKSITLLSIIIFAAGLLMCARANSLNMLLAGRLVEAVGSCGMLVLAFAVARDLFSAHKLARVYSILNGIISFSPLFGPFIGSLIDIKFNWPATFESLFVIVFLALALYFPLLPESWPEQKRFKISTNLISDYITILKNPIFYTYTIASAIGLTYTFLFCAISPVLLIKVLHVPEIKYGFYFCFMGISILVGSTLAAIVVERIGIRKTVIWGHLIALLGGSIMLGWYFLFGLSTYNFVVPMLLIGIGASFCMGAGSAGAITPYAKQAGMASALSGCCKFLLAACAGLIAANFVHTSLPLAIAAVALSIVGLMFLINEHKAHSTARH